MCNDFTTKLSSTTTDDAVRLFFPGQKISLKSPKGPEVLNFVICNLSTPVTKSIVVLAKPDTVAVNAEPVVIKIFDPRYLDERIAQRPSHPSYPWNFVNEEAAATARQENQELSDEDLTDITYSVDVEDLDGDSEALAAHYAFWEEHFYRLMMDSYDSEVAAYERLSDLQGSGIPRLIFAGELLPPDERAIWPPALVLEYIPSVSLRDVSHAAITPDLCAQMVSVIERFPLRGVIHNDITLTNIRFTPPEQPVRVVLIDFGCAFIRDEDADEEQWKGMGESDVWWAKQLVEDKQNGKFEDDARTCARWQI